MSGAKPISGQYDELLRMESLDGLTGDEEVETLELEAIQALEPYVSSYLGRLSREIAKLNRTTAVVEFLEKVGSVFVTVAEEASRSHLLAHPIRVLKRVAAPNSRFFGDYGAPTRLTLNRSALISNERSGLTMKDVLLEDIQSADEILIIMAFVKRAGVSILSEAFDVARSNGVDIRLITSLYMDGHDASAIDALDKLGVKICMDMSKHSSNLHAKGWLFKRSNGHSTAIIGSSNISTSALCSGNEWNLRITELESPHLIEEFEQQFEALWTNESFTRYVPSIHKSILASKLTKPEVEVIEVYDPIFPNPHQLEALKAIREQRAMGRRRNLVVAATGTGKTAIAALDFSHWVQNLEKRPTLLFVAHRQELLVQALRTFRRALQEPTFGSLWTGNSEPDEKDHVFVTVQTLSRRIKAGLIDLSF